MTSGGGAAVIVRENDPVAVCGVAEQESCAVTEIDEVPLPVGVPVRAPVVESVSPAGTPVAVHVTGSSPPDEVNWKL